VSMGLRAHQAVENDVSLCIGRPTCTRRDHESRRATKAQHLACHASSCCMCPWLKEYFEELVVKRGCPSAAAELHGLRRSNAAALNNESCPERVSRRNVDAERVSC
jgi:hypothetical protein